MKKIILLVNVICFYTTVTTAQNVGIGTTTPKAEMDIKGNLCVSEKAKTTAANATAAQTKSIVCNGLISYLASDSVGSFSGICGPNLNFKCAYIPTSTNSYFKIQITVDTGINNTSASIEFKDSSDNILLSVNRYNIPRSGVEYVINSKMFYCYWNTGSGTLNAGVTVKFKRVYTLAPTNMPEESVGENSLFYNSSKGSLVAGFHSTYNLVGNTQGAYSTALGYQTNTKGYAATAIGSNTIANGNNSFAQGSNSIAAGENSVALGNNTYATTNSFAQGYGAQANGFNSIAMGYNSLANNTNSVALGNLANSISANSIAIGAESNATGDLSLALGYKAKSYGNFSTSIGFNSKSDGVNSTAIGNTVNAYGENSLAMGVISTAIGYRSIAIGDSAVARGNHGVSIGNRNYAGDYAVAMGNAAYAVGGFSFALGHKIWISPVATGAFLFGDSDPYVQGETALTIPNSFKCRFNGGYYFISDNSNGFNYGVKLDAGQNSWSAYSDRNLKENFEPINGEDFLHKIASMPLTSWNYKFQNPKKLRHYGPMAQDFFAAFGKDKYGTIGCDTLINQQDFLGVNFIAIQALEKRSTEQNKLIKDQQIEIELLKKQIEAIKVSIQNK